MKAANPISTEARGKLRRWKGRARQRWHRFDRHYGSLNTIGAAQDFLGRGSEKGRRRAFEKLRKTFANVAVLEGVRIAGEYPIAVWSILRPREAVAVDSDDPGRRQDCVTINYLVVGVQGRGLGDGLWTLEVTDHALGRLLEREPAADLDSVLMQAHHSVLRADIESLRAASKSQDRLLVNAGEGVFACDFIIGRDVSAGHAIEPHLMARTWLHGDQLCEDQVAMPAGPPGKRAGESLFVPHPLRQIVETEPGRLAVELHHPPMPTLLAGVE
jgi:hypothetical protein